MLLLPRSGVHLSLADVPGLTLFFPSSGLNNVGMDSKEEILLYLRSDREALLWKLEGVTEREARMPRTPTGTSLVGIVKHMANVEVGYFGEVFGRPWPNGSEIVSPEALEQDPQEDWHLTEGESVAGIIDLYRRVGDFADSVILELPLDTIGTVPWWPEERSQLTLHRAAVHVLNDLSRHVGHADILREQLDGSTGLNPNNSNLPDLDWSDYASRLRTDAERY